MYCILFKVLDPPQKCFENTPLTFQNDVAATGFRRRPRSGRRSPPNRPLVVLHPERMWYIVCSGPNEHGAEHYFRNKLDKHFSVYHHDNRSDVRHLISS